MVGGTPRRRNLRWLYTVIVPDYNIVFALQTPVRVIQPNPNWSTVGLRDYKSDLSWGPMTTAAGRTTTTEAQPQVLCFHENHCDTQLWTRAAHWLQCLGRLSLPLSKGRKWVSTLWLSNNTWRWANVLSIAAYRRTQGSSLQLGLRVGGHLALTDFGPEESQWTLAYG